MGNNLPESVRLGTIGELFVQLKLLEFGIQAAAPIKDSGNDLIAIKEEVVKFVQVKTRLQGDGYSRNLPRVYHLVFYVDLKVNKDNRDTLSFDNSIITVFDNKKKKLGVLTKELVVKIWKNVKEK